MTKGMYHYIKQAWRSPDIQVLRQRMIEWRKSNAITKVEKPLRLDRARNLGYKSKKGFVVARVRIHRGGRKRKRINKARKSANQTNRKTLKMNYKWIAEQRANKKFTNLEVLNSYLIGKDGMNYFFEVILIDPKRPEITKSKDTKWITNPSNKSRVFRGLTSAGKKSRGLRHGASAHKVRPSVGAGKGKGK